MIPDLDLIALDARDPQALNRLRHAAEEIGFLTLSNTGISAAQVHHVIATYRAFFHLPKDEKAEVDMALTGANRGWGRAGSEQVDPTANPDFKQVFDTGFELTQGDPWLGQGLSVYAPNRWPTRPADFKSVITAYYKEACAVAMRLLGAIACAIGADERYFDDAFARPMALLRGNFYPARPDWAGRKDFGIAPHTDYGCLTLLATDGQKGLDVQLRDGTWQAVQAPVGKFVINFGEMLEIWTSGQVRATPHRVIGGAAERLSVPLFFNPSYDTNIAPVTSGEVRFAGDYLERRFSETYLHLQTT